MPFYLLTFRPQPSEFNLLNTFFTILKPQLEDNPNVLNYACVIEKDNTINRHCHTLVEFKQTKTKNNQLRQFYNKKVFQDFNKMLDKDRALTNHRWSHDDRQLKDTREDFLHVLGYIMKEINCNKRFYTFSEEDCVEALEYYYQRERIDKSQPCEDGLTVLTSKTIHANVHDFCKKNELRPREKTLVMNKMKKEGYMFSQVQVKDTFQELDMFMNKEEYADDDELPPEDFSDMYSKYMDLQSKMARYEQIFKNIEHDCQTTTGVPLSHQTIYKLCKSRFYEFSSDDEE